MNVVALWVVGVTFTVKHVKTSFFQNSLQPGDLPRPAVGSLLSFCVFGIRVLLDEEKSTLLFSEWMQSFSYLLQEPNQVFVLLDPAEAPLDPNAVVLFLEGNVFDVTTKNILDLWVHFLCKSDVVKIDILQVNLIESRQKDFAGSSTNSTSQVNRRFKTTDFVFEKFD